MDSVLELTRLAPDPHEEWRRLLRFTGWSEADSRAASRSVETLFKRGHELVVNTYDYLRQVPETAAVLGWEQGVDEMHLEERRRFFTVWLARALGLDTSDEFADYLFRAGKFHAGHGPRQIHTPPEYVVGSIGLVQAAFARYLAEAALPAEVVTGALAAWSKYLSVQLNQMLFGYWLAMDLKRGAWPVQCAVFGRLRPLVETPVTAVRANDGARVADILRKFFNYYPQTRGEALTRVWHSEENPHSAWPAISPAYVPQAGWRVLLNGRDVSYTGGFTQLVHAEDEISLFPPGR
jgi:molybdopterin converting factor small subunit